MARRFKWHRTRRRRPAGRLLDERRADALTAAWMAKRRISGLGVEPERASGPDEAAAGLYPARALDCGRFVAVNIGGRSYTVGKGYPGWRERVLHYAGGGRI